MSSGGRGSVSTPAGASAGSRQRSARIAAMSPVERSRSERSGTDGGHRGGSPGAHGARGRDRPHHALRPPLVPGLWLGPSDRRATRTPHRTPCRRLSCASGGAPIASIPRAGGRGRGSCAWCATSPSISAVRAASAGARRSEKSLDVSVNVPSEQPDDAASRAERATPPARRARAAPAGISGARSKSRTSKAFAQ